MVESILYLIRLARDYASATHLDQGMLLVRSLIVWSAGSLVHPLLPFSLLFHPGTLVNPF
ncbi:MAG: hypothetical protein GXP63_03150 [DPANN group archaeon]|nr:hypothetical protein [DPANN group archaeon]